MILLFRQRSFSTRPRARCSGFQIFSSRIVPRPSDPFEHLESGPDPVRDLRDHDQLQRGHRKRGFMGRFSQRNSRIDSGWQNSSYIDCVSDLGLQIEMIIVDSLLSAFKPSIIFEAAVSKIGSSLKPRLASQNKFATFCRFFIKVVEYFFCNFLCQLLKTRIREF